MSILLPIDVLSYSPSCADGVSDEEETKHRCFGAQLIQEANILLKLPQVVAATAQNIFHRFYYRKSLQKFDVFTVAQGCILLASKIEEEPKMLREVTRCCTMHVLRVIILIFPSQVLCVFHHMYQLRKSMRPKAFEIGGSLYTVWKNGIQYMIICIHLCKLHPELMLLILWNRAYCNREIYIERTWICTVQYIGPST
jgi:hypothetical protein